MEDLGALIERATKGDAAPLYARLERGSRLPGTRPNLDFAEQFALEMAGRNASRLAIAMATLHADEAPGGTAHEFLPMCGVLAVGAIAASDARQRRTLVPVIHDAAEDLRFRVRDVAAIALARVGAKDDTLVHETRSWMDGYFHAACVLRALAIPEWLHVLGDAEEVASRLHEAFELLETSARAAERYPGYKALVDAIEIGSGALAPRFGARIFDVLSEHAQTKNPLLRDLVRRTIADKRLGTRFATDIERVRATLERTEKPVRDPRSAEGPTRRRGKKRG